MCGFGSSVGRVPYRLLMAWGKLFCGNFIQYRTLGKQNETPVLTGNCGRYLVSWYLRVVVRTSTPYGFFLIPCVSERLRS